MLEREEIARLAGELSAAAQNGTAIPPPSATCPGFTLDDAYRVQAALIAQAAAQGRRRVGYKLGLTNAAAQRALGVEAPIFGPLFADMAVPAGGRFALAGRVAPRIEPELAFVMRAPLAGEVSAAEALAAIGHALPAFEIIDNRVLAADPASGGARNALDIVADLCGGCALVLGERRFDPRAVALAGIPVELAIGSARERGSFAAVFGSPENALVELARELARRGGGIAAGDIVLTGSPLKPAPLAPGDRVTADYGELGTVAVEIG